MNWDITTAIEFCKKLEAIAKPNNMHVALTGGLLYGGTGKDIDIVLYKVRQITDFDIKNVFNEFEKYIPNLVIYDKKEAWVTKGDYFGKPVDFLFPESKVDNEYAKSGEDLFKAVNI